MDALAPGLLVAAPNLQDPVFARTVILLAEASGDGAMGFVVNKPLDVTYADLSRELKVDVSGALRTEAVLFGGPVAPERGWVMYAGDDSDQAPFADTSISVLPGVRMSPTMEALHALLSGEVTTPFRLLLGHAGWAPEQLEHELAEGAWIPMDASYEMLFDVPLDKLWEAAIERLGITPGMLVGGGARA